MGLRDCQNGFGGNAGNLVTEDRPQIPLVHHAGKPGFRRTGR